MSKEPSFCATYCTPRCLQPICTGYCSDSCPPLLPSHLAPPFPSYHPPPTPRADSPISGPGVALITIFAASFFLITYYIVYRHCQQWQHPSSAAQNSTTANNGSNHGGATAPARHSSPSNGLDNELINKLAVHSYRRGRDNGVVGDTSCSVCLSEFREDDSLRLLPNCSHAFHVHCIDTWLKAHSNCPLCRVCVDISANSPPPQAAAMTELQRVASPVMRRSLSMGSAGDAGSQSSWAVDGMRSSVGCSGGEGSSRSVEWARVPIDRSVSFGRLVCRSPETRVNKSHIVPLV